MWAGFAKRSVPEYQPALGADVVPVMGSAVPCSGSDDVLIRVLRHRPVREKFPVGSVFCWRVRTRKGMLPSIYRSSVRPYVKAKRLHLIKDRYLPFLGVCFR